ncbi:PREDICTED: U4/U6.U5 small nuclear ribonucleoprotein 27 kDa protein-like [Priapulus caudatus]|uniref:U4/U6.U5 small nuclear ribonucleoprotein 27 kDa protein n=1 Tax=Priapulus caudatus TaxID=37621 RepID=A0ABM1EGD2_PRICU|nr:PREDICTED: U4/U6.U5 small nuclear ribonucleoprotein 27 kDa protein-like [Priapulus caudatus]
MPRRTRSRSRSPHRRERSDRSERKRSRSRDRERRPRERRKSRSPISSKRRSSKDRSPIPSKNGPSVSPTPNRGWFKESANTSSESTDAPEVIVLDETPVEITATDLGGKTEDEIAMMKVMGFGTFDTTKGKKMNGNDIYASNLIQKRKYRQYMNRKGGFNRPLDFVT